MAQVMPEATVLKQFCRQPGSESEAYVLPNPAHIYREAFENDKTSYTAICNYNINILDIVRYTKDLSQNGPLRSAGSHRRVHENHRFPLSIPDAIHCKIGSGILSDLGPDPTHRPPQHNLNNIFRVL